MNLEQISKQVSLLNRLLELLRMQEEPEESAKKYGWYEWDHICCYYKNPVMTKDKAPTLVEAWNHTLTQKAWSDELLKVARELAAFEAIEDGTASLIFDIQ